MSRILRVFSVLMAVVFAGNAFAAGYTCDSYKQFTSCATGRYMVGSASSTTYNGTPKAGNACVSCKGTYCPGGTAAPIYKVTLNANGGTAGTLTAIYASISAGWLTGTTSSSAGSTLSAFTAAQLPKHSKYTFTGFWSAASGGTQYVDEKGNFVASTQNITSAITLYAQYYDGCLAGTYDNGTSCATCPSSYPYSADGSVGIGSCYLKTSQGKFVKTANSAEVTCDAGGYCSGGTTVYYGNTGGRTPCGAGKYNANTGSTSSSACSSITAGCYGTSATSACPAVCGVNKYSTIGSAACSDCPSGYSNSGDTAASHANAASCKITVTGGYYIGTAGDNSSNWDKCSAGYYKASHTVAYGSTSSCTACGAVNKYSSAGASSCSTVSTGYYTTGGTETTRTSQSKCEAGYYCSGGVKTACGAVNKYSSAGASSCSTVSTGYYTTGGTETTRTSQSKCEAGSYCSGGVKTSCGGSLTSAAGSDALSDCYITCSAGYYLAGSGTSCSQATSGYYAAGGTYNYSTSIQGRNQCPNATYGKSASGSNEISDCYMTTTAGKYIATAQATSQTECPKGSYCPSTTVYYGNYDTSGGGRVACGAGKYNANTGSTSSSACSNITAGCYGTSATSACPAVCGASQYSEAGASSCTSCKSGYINSGTSAASHANASSCKITCAAGTWVASANAACTDVGDGYYRSGTDTVSQGKTGIRNICSGLGSFYAHSDSGRDSESDCYGTTTAGKYINGQYSSTQETCPAGKYCPATKVYYGSYAWQGGGMYYCGGSLTSAAGSDALSDCYIVCGAGYYLAGSGTSCTQATSGYYAAGGTYYYNTSTQGLSTCPSGYGSSSAGASSSSNCYLTTTAGKYIATAKSSTQSDCTVGNYCPATNVSYGNSGYSGGGLTSCGGNLTSAAKAEKKTDCYITCSAGYYLAGSGTSCSQATSGYYAAGGTYNYSASTQGLSDCPGAYAKSASGSNEISDCYVTTTAGKYIATSKATSQTECPKGSYCPSTTVYYGNYDTSGGGRVTCGAGKYNANTGSTSSSACLSITAGCYGTSATSACPAVCGTSQYSDAGASKCSDCPSGYINGGTSAASHAKAASCTITVNDGYYIGSAGDNSSNWDKCAAGTYKASHTVAYGSTSACDACGGNLTSDAGAKELTSCYITCSPGYYLAANDKTCSKASSGYYAPGNKYYYSSSIQGRSKCPDGYGNSADGSDANTDCYTNCSATTTTNGTLSAVNAKAYYSSSCSYNVTCNTGYQAVQSPSTNPSCVAKCVKITLDSGDAEKDDAIYTRYADTSNWYSDSSCSAKITSITMPTYSGWTFAGYYTTSTAPLKYTSDGTLPSTTYRRIAYNSSALTTDMSKPGSYSSNATWYARWAKNCQATATATCTGPNYANAAQAIYYINCCLTGYHNKNYADIDGADANGVCETN